MLSILGEFTVLFSHFRHPFLLQIFFTLCFAFGCASAAQANITLSFPDQFSLGKIYLLRPDYQSGAARQFVTGRACEAQGRVTIGCGQPLSFVGAYALTENMRVLSTLPADSLVHLDLRKLEIESKDLACIAHLRSLRRLELDSTDIDDQGLHYLRAMTSLQCLGLAKTLIRGTTLSELAFLPHLISLDLGRTRLAAGAMAQLKNLKALSDLRLDECGVRDTDVAYLIRCPNLCSLSLRDTPYLSARGLAALAACRRLKVLCYIGNRMTAEKSDALSHLSLDILILRRNDLSAAQAFALRKAMPHARIEIESESHLPMEVFAPLH